MNESHSTVLIIGAGAMGAGIAQVAASAGWTVLLRDVSDEVVAKSITGIRLQLDRLVEKGKLAPTDRAGTMSRIHAASAASDLRNCELVIEAIVENMEVKARVLRDLLPLLNDTAIIATNTSSLSVTAIGEAIGQPTRTVGMHFFNPAPVMKLVEVIAGAATQPDVVDRVAAIAEQWGKVVARCKDVPGFIVNHVARPYYLEAFRILEDGYATPQKIDDAMKLLGGFRMGPLELTDLIGQDVNTATTRSVWEQLGKPPLLKPSTLQESLVNAGHLGRKTKRGVYRYDVEPPVAAIHASPYEHTLAVSRDVTQAVDEFVSTASVAADSSTSTQRYTFARILIAIFAQAIHAEQRGVASRSDIDTAMKFGVNYPRGPFEWMERIGEQRVHTMLAAMARGENAERFDPPKILKVKV